MAGTYKKKLIDEILDDRERLALQMFIDNEVQQNAVKKVLLFSLYNNGTLTRGKKAEPMVNSAFGLVFEANEKGYDDARLGRNLAVMFEGINTVEVAWNALSLYKKENEPRPSKDNPAV